MISNRNLLIIIAISIIILSILLGSISKKENFDSNNKDTQKIGTDQNVQLNNETNYKNNILKNEDYKVPNNVNNPIDYNKYEVYNEKIVKGKRLQGTYNISGGSITLDEYGRPIGQIMSLQQSKEVCDFLKDKCAGFILQSSENRDRNIVTYFVESLKPGFEDPNTEDHISLKTDEKTPLTSYQNYTSYVKKI